MVLKYERRNINIEDACTTRALPIPSANAAIIYVCLLLSLILSRPYDDLSLCGGLVRALSHNLLKTRTVIHVYISASLSPLVFTRSFSILSVVFSFRVFVSFASGCLRRHWLGYVSCSLFPIWNQPSLTKTFLLWETVAQMPPFTCISAVIRAAARGRVALPQ